MYQRACRSCLKNCIVYTQLVARLHSLDAHRRTPAIELCMKRACRPRQHMSACLIAGLWRSSLKSRFLSSLFIDLHHLLTVSKKMLKRPWQCLKNLHGSVQLRATHSSSSCFLLAQLSRHFYIDNTPLNPLRSAFLACLMTRQVQACLHSLHRKIWSTPRRRECCASEWHSLFLGPQPDSTHALQQAQQENPNKIKNQFPTGVLSTDITVCSPDEILHLVHILPSQPRRS